MKVSKRFIAVILLIASSNWLFSYSVVWGNTQSPRVGEVYSEYLVKLKNNKKIYKVDFREQLKEDEAKTQLRSWSELETVEPNYSFRAAFLPNDRFFDEQTYLTTVRAPQAWDLALELSNEVVVAVLDTGVDIAHPDLKNRIWTNKKEIPNDGIDNDKNGFIDDVHGWDFLSDINDPGPRFNESYTQAGIHHGTVIAGIIAAEANNSEGVAGISPVARIMAIRALNNEGGGNLDAVLRGIDYAVKNGAQILNLSFVGSNYSKLLRDALKDAWRKGVIIVAAAGNENTGQSEDLDKYPAYPICLDQGDADNFIIGVGAVMPNDTRALFSNYGNCIDIMAPGSRFFGLQAVKKDGADFKDQYGGYWSGTSVAAPVVSGAISILKAINTQISSNKILEVLFDTAENIDASNPDYEGRLGKGKINVYKAVDFTISNLKGRGPFEYILVSAPDASGGPHVRGLDGAGLGRLNFMAYDEKFRGGVNIGVGDVDGDGIIDIVTVPKSRGTSHIRIFDELGNLKYSFWPSDDRSYTGGMNLAVADIDGDGVSEIIVAPRGGREPMVSVYSYDGTLRSQFLAFDASFKKEVYVGAFDFENDGVKEIIVGAGEGGGPHVRVFDGEGNLKLQFFAFNQRFKGGVTVTGGDVNNDGMDEIIVGVASGANSYIRVFDHSGFLLTQFLAYAPNFYNGVRIAVGDIDRDGKKEIIAAPGKGIEPEIRIFNYKGNLINKFLAYNKNFKGGVLVAAP